MNTEECKKQGPENGTWSSTRSWPFMKASAGTSAIDL